MASLSKTMFATYIVNLPRARSDGRGDDDNDDDDGDDGDDGPLPATFQISLPAFLEALQIFGVTDTAAARQTRQDADGFRGVRGGGGGGGGGYSSTYSNSNSVGRHGHDAFSHQILGMPGTCSFLYLEDGAPLGIILEEGSVKTTCNLATYVPEALEAIPFDRDDLAFKIIMQPRWLLDALVELAPSSPNLLTVVVTPRAPFLRLACNGGPLGSSSVDFARGGGSSGRAHNTAAALFESITVHEQRWAQSFKFDLVKAATEAMRIASKVSIRGDRQGVLSLQFMVEMDGGGSGQGSGGGVSSTLGSGRGMQWLHFSFVPFLADEEGDEEGEGSGGSGSDGDEQDNNQAGGGGDSDGDIL